MEEFQCNLYLTFVDYTTAFDSIFRDKIWDLLRAADIPPKLIKLIRAQYDGFQCRVLHNSRLSEPFSPKTGVRQGCLLSPLLFLLVIDSVIRNALDGEHRGIQWTFDSHLEDLDYADDICLLSTRRSDMQSKLDDLVANSANVGLKVNTGKTKAMEIRGQTSNPFVVEHEDVEFVDKFCYLGSIVATNDSAKSDIEHRIGKATATFYQLRNIWKSTIISTRTKVNIFKSNVLSVLLYSCETWLTTTAINTKLQGFTNRSLRYILKIWWPNVIRSEDLHNRCDIEPIKIIIKKRKWQWIGHTLRKEPDEICRQALDWNPQGSRKRGRPKTTWRSSLAQDIKDSGKTWSQIKALANDREAWRIFVEALCSR